MSSFFTDIFIVTSFRFHDFIIINLLTNIINITTTSIDTFIITFTYIGHIHSSQFWMDQLPKQARRDCDVASGRECACYHRNKRQTGKGDTRGLSLVSGSFLSTVM